jgi:predicted CXXCH cytochrome family protein
MILVPSVVLAAVGATSHDMGLSYTALETAGICSPCHLPHGTPGDRLFPNAGPGGLNAGAVGQLCAVCHHTGGGYNVALGGSAASDTYVYGALSHGVDAGMTVADHPDQDTTYLAASTLPYVSDATPTMECTSCHNVHDDTNRPFLRTDMDSLCSTCHDNRHYDGGGAAFVQGAAMATWGAGNTQASNPGSHPVGTDVVATLNDALQTIVISGEFQVGLSAVVDGWNLGGHLDAGASGGVVCVSCHAVHGAQDDADDTLIGTATEHVPYTNFLVIDQASTGINYTTPGTLSRSVASGFGDFNPLCEDCHNGTLGAGYTLNGADTAVDPGATGYTHPLDGIVPSADGWVTAFPANWPVGGGFNTAMSPVAICESCHVMHPTANNTANVVRPDIVAAAPDYGYVLRDGFEDVCANCHTGSITGHHPVAITYDSTDVGYLTYTSGAGGDTLECRTCHAANGAHNWSNIDGIGLDPGWIPVDNARSVTAAVDAVATTLSQTCMDCHFGADGNNATYSPTVDAVVRDPNSTGYGFLGEGTHFMGSTVQDDAALTAALNPQLATVFNTAATLWPATITEASGAGWSRFRQLAGAGTPAILACESCHELEPDKNNSGAGGYNLLLASFSDGTHNGGRDQFCETCHLPPGTHPMTGDTVDRTGVALDIDVTKDWLTAPAANATWDAATEQMSCDSCHQVHDAETDSANMILEAADADLPVTAGALVDATNFVPNFPDGNLGPNHEAFCQYCHGY